MDAVLRYGLRFFTQIKIMNINKIKDQIGISLIEVVLVITIMGILVSVAMNSASQFSETAKIEETKQELDNIAIAITGNSLLNNNGVRTDFGYVGDIGALPNSLDNLNSDPGSYATWKGPYIKSRFTQITNDYKQDAWGATYSFNGTEITSTGSGSDIVKKIASSTDDLLLNKVSGIITDLDGTIPGNSYKDSLSIRLTYPNGSGNYTTKNSTPDMSGYFNIDSIPIGNHDIEIIYIPDNDTLTRFVSVIPGSNSYGNYILSSNLWSASSVSSGSIEYVANSDTLFNSSHCDNFSFWIVNNSGSTVTISSITLSWSSPTAYFQQVFWNNTQVINEPNPTVGSGETTLFNSSQTIADGESVKISVKKFESAHGGGGHQANMENTDITVSFSDGTTITVPLGAC